MGLSTMKQLDQNRSGGGMGRTGVVGAGKVAEQEWWGHGQTPCANWFAVSSPR